MAAPILTLESCIELGKLTKEWGIRGEIAGYFHNPESALPASLTTLYVQSDADPTQVIAVPLARPPKPHHKTFVFKLNGIETPEAAKEWRGKVFYYPKSLLPPATDDNFYWFEVMGSEVWDDAGERWGVARRLEGAGLSPYLVIEDDAHREILYPAHPDMLMQFDRTQRRLIVKAIEGLRGD